MTDAKLPVTLVLSEPFKPSDVTAIMRLVRYIERHDRDNTYTVTIDDPGHRMTVDEARTLMEETLGSDSKITVLKRQ